MQLARLGEALGAYLGVGRLSFESWEEAIRQLLRLGAERPLPVVLDEFDYVLESDPTVDSVIAGAVGPGWKSLCSRTISEKRRGCWGRRIGLLPRGCTRSSAA